MNHKEYLLQAAKIIDTRGTEYGSMEVMHKRIADIFNLICPDRKLEPHHIALVHMATKLGRLHENPNHEDSVVDLEAYTSFFGELVNGGAPSSRQQQLPLTTLRTRTAASAAVAAALLEE